MKLIVNTKIYLKRVVTMPKRYALLLLCLLTDVFYFFFTGTLVVHCTLLSCMHFLFQEHSLIKILYSALLLGLAGLLIFHSYTIYYLSCLPWAVCAYMIRNYMGRKGFYLCSLITLTLLTHTLLLYFSIFKPWVTSGYTFRVITCNLIVMYIVLLKFPIVEHGDRL